MHPSLRARRTTRALARAALARAALARAALARAALARAALAVTLAAPAALAAQGAPDTDVWLATLERRGDSLVVGTPRDLTARPGYDNQPSFSRDGRTLWVTRRAPNAPAPRADRDVQTDIWAYPLPSGTPRAAFETAESEYSPRVTDDGRALVVVRVELDSAQHLWRLPLDGTAPARLVPSVKPVGYFAWVGPRAVMQVLGAPRTLQVVDTLTGRRDTIVSNPGRSIQRIPGRATVSFVQQGGTGATLHELDPATRTVTPLVTMPPKGDDHAWLDTRTVLASDGTRLLSWTRGTTAWRIVADWSAAPFGNVTRLAVSPDGRTLAFVAESR